MNKTSPIATWALKRRAVEAPRVAKAGHSLTIRFVGPEGKLTPDLGKARTPDEEK